MATEVLPFDMNLVLMLITALSIIVAVFMFLFAWNIKKTSPIAVVEAKCKKSGNPMIKVVDPTGRFEIMEGVVGHWTDATYKSKNKGLQVRPEILSKVEAQWSPARVPLYEYHTLFHFTTSGLSGRALITAVEYIREKYPALSFISDDLELIETLFTDSSAMQHDCELLLKSYDQSTDEMINVVDDGGNFVLDDDGNVVQIVNPEYITPLDLKDMFEDAKKAIPNIPLRKGFMSMSKAMALIPEGTTAQDMTRYGDEVLRGERMKNPENYQKILIWIAAASIPLGIVALGIIAMKVL